MSCDCGYSFESIEKLQNQINIKLAKTINRENASRKNDLNLDFNDELYIKLSHYNEILTKIKNCSSCYKSMNLANIFDAIKTTIQKV